MLLYCRLGYGVGTVVVDVGEDVGHDGAICVGWAVDEHGYEPGW